MWFRAPPRRRWTPPGPVDTMRRMNCPSRERGGALGGNTRRSACRKILYSAILLVAVTLLVEFAVRVRELLVSGHWSPADFWWGRQHSGRMYLPHALLGRVLRPGYADGRI